MKSLTEKLKKILRRFVPSAILKYYQYWNMNYKKIKFERRIVEHSYGNEKLKVLLADPMAQGWYDHDWEALPEIKILSNSRLKKNAVVFDIGAHQGIVGMMLGRIVGEHGKVVMVEANSYNVEVCQRNLELNNIRCATIFDVVIGRDNSEVFFNNAWNGTVAKRSTYGGVRKKKCITLDSLAERFGFPDCVFIDVEGSEFDALMGASTLLKMHVDWSVEVHVNCGLEELGASAQQIINFFPAQHFDLYIHYDDEKSSDSYTMQSDISKRFFLTAISKRVAR